jgi:hypothetical protein
MTLPSILALAGCAALLLGLLGGGLKAKEIEVPQITNRIRVISASLGVVLIGVALWLYALESKDLTVGIVPTDTPVAAIAPVSESHAPVLKSVVIREDSSTGNLILYQDVSYSDLDGDADIIDWILVSSTDPKASVWDGKVENSVEQQKQGAIFTGVWNCNGMNSSTVIQAVLIDKAGNKSEPLEYDLICH